MSADNVLWTPRPWRRRRLLVLLPLPLPRPLMGQHVEAETFFPLGLDLASGLFNRILSLSNPGVCSQTSRVPSIRVMGIYLLSMQSHRSRGR